MIEKISFKSYRTCLNRENTKPKNRLSYPNDKRITQYSLFALLTGLATYCLADENIKQRFDEDFVRQIKLIYKNCTKAKNKKYNSKIVEPRIEKLLELKKKMKVNSLKIAVAGGIIISGTVFLANRLFDAVNNFFNIN